MGSTGRPWSTSTGAIELDAEDAWAIASRAWTYRLKGDYDRALVDLDRAIELDPEYAWPSPTG